MRSLLCTAVWLPVVLSGCGQALAEAGTTGPSPVARRAPAPPSHGSGCGPRIERLTRELALEWIAEDRHHQNLLHVIELLRLHTRICPRSPHATAVARHLRQAVETLRRCGCAGRPKPEDR